MTALLQTDLTTELELTASNGLPSDRFGTSVAGLGDIDGDGSDDIAVGALLADGAGAAYVYLGSSAGIDLSSEVKLGAFDGTLDDWASSSMAAARSWSRCMRASSSHSARPTSAGRTPQ